MNIDLLFLAVSQAPSLPNPEGPVNGLLLSLVIALSPVPFDLVTCVCWIRKLRNGSGSSGCTLVPALLLALTPLAGICLAVMKSDESQWENIGRILPPVLLGIVLLVAIHVLLCYHIPTWVHRRWLASGPDLEKYPYAWTPPT